MTPDPSIDDRAADVDLVEGMLARIATPDEAAAARRLLGVEREAARLSAEYAPEPPPLATAVGGIDELAVARDALERYTQWRDSYPDDDPTPLAKRERTVRLAVWSVDRLERTS